MPDPTITIGSPSSGGTVPRTFTASGTYTPTTGTPTIGVALKDSTGNFVATNPNVNAANGAWSGQLTAPQAYTGASIVAGISTGATDTVTNITVQ
jgi:hypothetical protein